MIAMIETIGMLSIANDPSPTSTMLNAALMEGIDPVPAARAIRAEDLRM